MGSQRQPGPGPVVLMQWLVNRTRGQWFPVGVIVIGLCLLSPVLATGLVADDYLHQLMLREDPGLGGLEYRPWDLFRFADGTKETTTAMVNDGVFPWWADPHARVAFFRPLSSLTHFVDHQLWPSRPWLMHLQSLVWFGLLLSVVAAMYRRFIPSMHVSGLALLLFAVDDSHAGVVGWVANRNSLVALSLALPALLVHDRLRRGEFSRGVWLGPLIFSISLLAGEMAVSVLAYLLAYAICLDRGSLAKRLAALVPYGIVLVAWKLISLALDYGVAGSGVYIDPLRDPFGFIIVSCERLPVLGLALVGAPFADLWEVYPMFSDGLQPMVFLLAIVVLGVFIRALWPLCLREPRVRFWALGMTFSLLPVCATWPNDRLLLAPGIGAMALIADLILAGWAARRRCLPALGALTLTAVHLVAAPVLAPLRAAHVDDFSELLRATDATLPHGDELRGRTLILLNPPIDPFAIFLPVYRAAAREPRPIGQLLLATGVSDVSVRTLDAHTIAVQPEDGFLSNAPQLMLRRSKPGLKLGEIVEVDAARIEVTALTEDGRPLEIEARFERRLDDSKLIWMQWLNGSYERFEVPTVGKTVVLPMADIGRLLFSG